MDRSIDRSIDGERERAEIVSFAYIIIIIIIIEEEVCSSGRSGTRSLASSEILPQQRTNGRTDGRTMTGGGPHVRTVRTGEEVPPLKGTNNFEKYLVVMTVAAMRRGPCV